jgi:ATP-dependent DNA helicase RecG
VVALGVKRYRHGQKSVFELILDDGTARLHCRWWNLPFMEKYFEAGNEVVVFGKPLSLRPRTMDHPETEVVEPGEERFIHFNRLTPIYPLTEGLPQRWVRSLIWRALERFGSQVPEPWPGPLTAFGASAASPGSAPADPLPTRARAIRRLHFPENDGDIELSRRRLALDEFVELQRQIQLRRRQFESRAQALPCGGDNRLIKPFLAALKFKLTAAQTAVLREIRADLRRPHPMRRLLQGDVGSGKTVVAACAALMAIESGYPVALMAPTEILAEQHFQVFRAWFEPLGVVVQLRTGSHKKVESRESRGRRIGSPRLSILVPLARRSGAEPARPFPSARMPCSSPVLRRTASAW